LKKWIKIEEVLNEKLVALFSYLAFLYQKHCPQKIQSFFINARQFAKNSKTKSINSIKENAKNAIVVIPLFFKKLADKLENFQGYLTHIVLSMKSVKKEKIQFKVMYHSLQAAVIAVLFKIKTWYMSLKRSTIVVSLTTSSVVAYSLFNIYYQGNTIFKSLGRKPASVDTSTFIDVRPKYYKRDERFFNLYHIKLPLFIESVSDHKNIKLDITIQPSNKYIKEYFFRNEYIVKDKLSVMVYPVIPSLPVTEEGKLIIKEKVKIELNNLLKEKKIDGVIEEIYVNSILGT
jgi:hypothetical protein